MSKLIPWIITVIFVAQASPFLGFLLVLGTAIYLVGRTAPASTPQERTKP